MSTSLARALALVSLTVLLCGTQLRARAQEEPLVQDEPLAQEPSQAAPTVPTNAPTPGTVAKEPVARADDMDFEANDLPRPLALSMNEPTFNSETKHKRIPNLPLLVTGTLVLTAAYVPAVIGAAVSQRPGDNKLYIPLAGPFLAMNRGAADKPGHKALFVVDGVAQGLGGLGVLLGFMIPEKVTRRWYLIGKRESVRFTPGRIAGGYGLNASGRF
jgi:hypothetical protein